MSICRVPKRKTPHANMSSLGALGRDPDPVEGEHDKLTLGPVDLFVFFLDLKSVVVFCCLSKLDFGEIDFTNDRLKLNFNVKPTSWDSRPF